jgi:hypothetical protein
MFFHLAAPVLGAAAGVFCLADIERPAAVCTRYTPPSWKSAGQEKQRKD